MKSLFAATAALALMTAAAPAMAESYGSIGYTHIDGDDATLGAVTGRVGWRSNSFFGVEAEASAGVKDDDFTVGATTATAELDYQYAGYVTGTVPVSPNLDIIGRVGYGQQKLEVSAGGVSVSDKIDSVNYGVGLQYNWGANGIRGDYTRHDFSGDGNGAANAFAVSYVRKF